MLSTIRAVPTTEEGIMGAEKTKTEKTAERLQKAGTSMNETGKSLFWFGVAVLAVIFVVIPAVFH
jgi:hypothetical protein